MSDLEEMFETASRHADCHTRYEMNPSPASIEKPAGHRVDQHLAWLKVYLHGMTADNWIDMSLRAQRQLDQLQEDLPRAVHAAVNDVLDKIVDAGSRSASLGARHIAELALSMKHKETRG